MFETAILDSVFKGNSKIFSVRQVDDTCWPINSTVIWYTEIRIEALKQTYLA